MDYQELMKNTNTFGIYTVYDRVAKTFAPIFMQKNNATAIRTFRSMKQERDLAFDDLELHLLGTYSMKEGNITVELDGAEKPILGQKEVIAIGKEVAA